MKILVIGCGMDVTSRKRGKFINETFDEVVFIKYSINHYETFKEYTGDPTIWVKTEREFYKYSRREQLDHDEKPRWDLWWNEEKQIKAQNRIYENISKTGIKEIWEDSFSLNGEKDRYPFTPPKNIHGKQIPIVIKKYTGYVGTIGLAILFEAIRLGYTVYYLGFDSYIKGEHYFHHIENTYGTYTNYMNQTEFPSGRIIPPDMEQYVIIKKLEKQGLITHVDKIIDCKL